MGIAMGIATRVSSTAGMSGWMAGVRRLLGGVTEQILRLGNASSQLPPSQGIHYGPRRSWVGNRGHGFMTH